MVARLLVVTVILKEWFEILTKEASAIVFEPEGKVLIILRNLVGGMSNS
jgi:hypothetical protein